MAGLSSANQLETMFRQCCALSVDLGQGLRLGRGRRGNGGNDVPSPGKSKPSWVFKQEAYNPSLATPSLVPCFALPFS